MNFNKEVKEDFPYVQYSKDILNMTNFLNINHFKWIQLITLHCFLQQRNSKSEVLNTLKHKSPPTSLLWGLVVFCPSLLKSCDERWLPLFTSTLDFRCKRSWRKWGQSWKCRANTRRGWRAAAGRWNIRLASPARDYRSAQILLFTILICFLTA